MRQFAFTVHVKTLDFPKRPTHFSLPYHLVLLVKSLVSDLCPRHFQFISLIGTSQSIRLPTQPSTPFLSSIKPGVCWLHTYSLCDCICLNALRALQVYVKCTIYVLVLGSVYTMAVLFCGTSSRCVVALGVRRCRLRSTSGTVTVLPCFAIVPHTQSGLSRRVVGISSSRSAILPTLLASRFGV